MFSGIIEELGVLKRILKRGRVYLFEIQSEKIYKDVKIGDSISVNGVCLTVVGNSSGILSFELMPETLKNTSLSALKQKEKINLERSLKIGDRISGHFVTGHVDCVGRIRRKYFLNNNPCFEIVFPIKFSAYLLLKGSISLDGISLTIMDRKSDTFRVCIIPHTLKQTNLAFKKASDKVNIEFDILAKKTAKAN